MIRTLARRIELAERVAAARSKSTENCICFPGPEPPSFTSDEQQEAAHRVKCRLHGDRFPKAFHLYMAPWRIERIVTEWKNRNDQYKKAWLASGLPPLGSDAGQ
jgi:chorismate mutase